MQHIFYYFIHYFFQKLMMSQFQIYYLIFNKFTMNQIIKILLLIFENFQILSLFFSFYVRIIIKI